MQIDMRLVRKLIAVLAGLALAACQPSPSSQSGPPAGGMPPPEVQVMVVQPRDLQVVYEYSGQIAGVREVEIRPRVSGILERWNYSEGATVAAGQSLFTIDPVPFRAALAKAEAALASAEARQAQAARTVERYKPLYEAKMISQKNYDDAVSAEEVAAADAKAAQAAAVEARLDLAYTRVEAPISGISGRALQPEGSLVQAQQTLLTTLSQIDPARAVFSFTEAEHLKFSRDVASGALKLPKDNRFDVGLKLADGSEYPHAGKVDFTDVRVNPSTGTIDARAVVVNPQHLLRPGQFVRVLLSGGVRPHALAVPQRAVLEGPNTKLVMTVNAQGVVEPRPVQVGDWAGEDWIVTRGLQPGDKVIVDGLVRARPGAPVTIAQPAPAAAAASAPATAH